MERSLAEFHPGAKRNHSFRVRMALHFARSFPALQDSLWSMEELQ